jgi:hypothetical protein
MIEEELRRLLGPVRCAALTGGRAELEQAAARYLISDALISVAEAATADDELTFQVAVGEWLEILIRHCYPIVIEEFMVHYIETRQLVQAAARCLVFNALISVAEAATADDEELVLQAAVGESLEGSWNPWHIGITWTSVGLPWALLMSM